jgi:sRNA-binding regulator protein Hfq
MSLENLLPSFSDLGSVSVLILLAAALIYYFGKLINDVKVERFENTADYYIQGLIFSIIYIGLSSFLVWVVTSSLKFFASTIVAIILEVIIAGVLVSVLQINLGRYTLFSRFQQVFETQLNVEKEKNPAIRKADEFTTRKGKSLSNNSLTTSETYANFLTNIFSLFIFSILIVWSVFPQFQSQLTPEAIFLFILTFLNFTFLAINFGYVGIYHPQAKIFLDNGQQLEGRIVKVGTFVNFINEKDGKKYFVNSSKITYVEESMFKEKFEALLKEKEAEKPKS